MEDKRGFDPRRKAVAVNYNPMDSAPRVVAKGQGFVAEQIIKKGEEHDVPIIENRKLTEELERIELGSHIPPELYEVVAQVLIFVSDMDKIERYRAGRA